MQTNFYTTRYVRGQLTGGPARDDAGSVGIRVAEVIAPEATECRLVGPVSLVNVTASGTLPAGVPRIYADERNARQPCFVGEELTQLGERPTVENSPLLAPSPDPFANASEFFDGNAAPAAFSGSNDLLTDYVVRVAAQALLLARQFLQPTLGGAGLFLLKLGPQPAIPMPDGIPLVPCITFSFAVGSDVDHSQINAKEAGRFQLGRLRDAASRHQVVLASNQHQVRLALSVPQHGSLPLSAHERNTQPAAERPNRNRGCAEIPGQDSIIVRGGSRRTKGSLDRFVQLVRIGNLGDGTDSRLRRQPKAFATLPVAEFVEIELAERLQLPSNAADVIARGIEGHQRAQKRIGLSAGRQKFELRRQVHSGLLLSLYVLLNRGCRNSTRTADVVAPAPMRRHGFEWRKLLPQFVGRKALDLIRDVLPSVGRRCFQKQVNVVGHYFEHHDLAEKLFHLRLKQG